ncbi:DUF4402 domain-containing protein [Phenylobacterium soli]|uniref:DUF4402 domain-containing protein n=1 Tax=Phenylobacterium soli TaxID=2170551 RepID=UPI00105767E4|nr:DUF4402 domain-containing protein [Phenylobacterium soli]
MSLSSTAPNIGKVASGTSTTNFTVASGSGAVSIGSGGAQFVPYGATRTALTTITINCSGGNKCKNNNINISINAGSATGRASGITALSADFSGSSTARLTSGATSASSSSGALSFTIKPVATGTSGSASFTVGMTIPILPSGTVGLATAAYTITASGTGYTTGSGSAAGRATVEDPLSMSKNSDLSFGRLVLLTGQSGAATWAAADQSWTVTGATAMGSRAIGKFTVTGTASQAINFSVPSSITMTNGHGDTLPITVSTTAQGTQLIGTNGQFIFYVGGQISYSSSTPTGAYTATFTVSANYQ